MYLIIMQSGERRGERDLQLAEEGREQSWNGVFLSNVQLWVHWASGDQKMCGYREDSAA